MPEYDCTEYARVSMRVPTNAPRERPPSLFESTTTVVHGWCVTSMLVVYRLNVWLRERTRVGATLDIFYPLRLDNIRVVPDSRPY